MTMSQANNAWLFFCREEFFCVLSTKTTLVTKHTPRTLSIAAHASNDNALSLLKTRLTKINKFSSWRDFEKCVEFINHHGKTEGSESERERQNES